MRKASGRSLAQAALVVGVASAIALVNAVNQYVSGRALPGGPEFSVWGVLWPHLLDTWIWAALYPASVFLCRRWPLTAAPSSPRQSSFRGKPGSAGFPPAPRSFHETGPRSPLPRAAPSSPRQRRAIAAHVAGAATLVLVAFVLNFGVIHLALDGHVDVRDLVGLPFRNMLVHGWRHHLISYALVLSAAAGLEAGRRARAEVLRDAELRTRLASARLETLRAQLHPHFLFNTLNGILPLVEDDPKAAARAVGELAALLRESLRDGTPYSDVSGELAFLERYLGLLKLRFGDRLGYSLRVSPEAGRAMVPRLLLQPLVENAVQHGLGSRAEGGRVEVEAHRSEDTLVLEVRDDGSGLSEAPDRATGLGLSNTRARLAALHGDGFSLALTPRPGGGVVARIVMPFEAAA